MKKLKNEDGLTLIEILAGLSIAAIFIIMASSMFVSMSKVSNDSKEEMDLRNEAVVILQTLDLALLNMDEVTPDGPVVDGKFKKFIITDKRNGETDRVTEISVKEDQGIFIVSGSDSKQINSDFYNLNNTFFKNDGNKLQVYLEIESGDKTLNQFKSYSY